MVVVDMKREDIRTTLVELDAIEQHLDNRVEVWRQVVNPDGTLGRRICRGSFYRPRGTEPPLEGNTE
jgi:hypothetical protein